VGGGSGSARDSHWKGWTRSGRSRIAHQRWLTPEMLPPGMAAVSNLTHAKKPARGPTTTSVLARPHCLQDVTQGHYVNSPVSAPMLTCWVTTTGGLGGSARSLSRAAAVRSGPSARRWIRVLALAFMHQNSNSVCGLGGLRLRLAPRRLPIVCWMSRASARLSGWRRTAIRRCRASRAAATWSTIGAG
jgi:hypothetical protein